MNKRNLASLLWFLAGWSGGGLFVGLMGLPSLLAFVPGVLLAIFVQVDAGGFLWSHTVTGRRIVPMNQFAAELDKRVDQWPAVGADTRRV